MMLLSILTIGIRQLAKKSLKEQFLYFFNLLPCIYNSGMALIFRALLSCFYDKVYISYMIIRQFFHLKCTLLIKLYTLLPPYLTENCYEFWFQYIDSAFLRWSLLNTSFSFLLLWEAQTLFYPCNLPFPDLWLCSERLLKFSKGTDLEDKYVCCERGSIISNYMI